jgi:hypothetical protein
MTWHSVRVDADKVGSTVTNIRKSVGVATASARCETGFVITYVVFE